MYVREQQMCKGRKVKTEVLKHLGRFDSITEAHAAAGVVTDQPNLREQEKLSAQ